jgi:predicted SnoaL-like aldol condensation-catalyzing enzyme
MKSFLSISAMVLFTVVFANCSEASNKTDAAADSGQAASSGSDTSGSNMQALEANKKIAVDFIQAMYGDKDSAAIDKYIADDIKQHDPILQDGKVWLKKVLLQVLQNPNMEKKKIDIKQVAAEGDMVWTLVRDVAPNGKVFARVEIFRIRDQKIVERWLIMQQEPKSSENKNTMF